MTKTTPAIILLLGIAPGLAGCNEEEPATPQRDDPAVQELRQQALEKKAIERVPDEPTPVTGEVPSGILSLIRADLAQHTGGEEPTLVKAEAVNWPDGSLGCAKPGTVYTQAPVQGYQVVFEVDGERWDYRASSTGGFFLCNGTPDLGRGSENPTQ